MGLKPRSARWFELLTPSEALESAVEALARTGSVQVEAHAVGPSTSSLGELASGLESYERLLQRFRPYLPKTGLRRSARGTPDALLRRSLDRLTAWSVETEPLVRALERLERARAELLLLREFVQAGGSLSELRETGPTFRVRLIAVPPSSTLNELPDAVLRHRVDGREHSFFVIAGLPEVIVEAEAELARLEGRSVALDSAQTELEPRLAELDQQLADNRSELEASWTRHDVARAVADLERLRWFVASVPCFPQTANFSLVTGWSDDASGERLRSALTSDNLPGLLRFPPPPEGLDPPVILVNPKWARPFEQFAALLGTPSRHESDPSVVLALLVPLIFGYMFGDVGHGLTLLVLGIFLRRRYPFLAVLIPAGLSAALFGLVFGCVFSLEGVIEPLWTHPLASPLALLAGSLVLGGLVLSLGVCLSALGSIWRGKFPAEEIALFFVYGGALALFVDGRALALVAGGFVLAGSAHAIEAREKRVRKALAAMAELLERALQLGVGTLSFARVGAFALAHAGLSAAVFTLSQATSNIGARVLVLVLGNALVLAIEGLVVSIQTTRLVLFEFFARFLRGEGRVFRPLAPPTESSA